MGRNGPLLPIPQDVAAGVLAGPCSCLARSVSIMARSVFRFIGIRVVPLVLLQLTLAPTLFAQEVPPPEAPLAPLDTTPPPPNNPPYVELSPWGGSFGSTSLAISIEWCDDTGLNSSSREIKLNGVNVTSLFTYTTPGFSEPCAGFNYIRRSQGTVTLNVGSNSFSGKICDTSGKCTTESTTYVVTSQVAPTVALENYNPDNMDRSLCLTSGAGEAAAYQCGDLAIVHAMPGYATKGRDRALSLLYNSATAAPRAVVAANVTTPSTGSKPDTVYAELLDGSTVKASAKFQSWNVGETRQIVLAFSTSGYTTRVDSLTLKVQNRYNGVAPKETVVPLQVLIVNRTGSEFGGGWWPAGVEQLVLNQPGGILWVGGDGSAKVYAPFGTNVWRAPAGAFRDSLVLSGGVYTRKLKHGVQVRFDAAGRHIQTVNRQGDTTYLNWTGSPALLTSIKVPPSSAASGITYTLAYAAGKLDKITDPAGRILDATISSGKLTSLKDPDNKTVSFAYDASPNTYRILKRTNRRSFATRYEFTGDLRLTGAHVQISVSPADTARTLFRPWDQKGLVVGVASSVKQAARVDTVYTKMVGPRVNVADDALFWIDKWGAPEKIRDPLNLETTITRGGDPNNPALPTSILFPDGRSATMTWDGRGNLLTEVVAASGSPTATTRYTYKNVNTADSPDTIVDPTNVKTIFSYNTMGLTSRVTAPNGHKTGFEYHAATAAANLRGLLKAVADSSTSVYDPAQKKVLTQHPKTRFAYDTWGNVVSDTSPMNNVRIFTRDGTRRISDLYDPENHRTHYTYDALNRVTESSKYVEAGAQLKTRTVFATDVVDSIVDPRGVYRRFIYDAAGRQTAEIDELGKQITRTYDEAGLPLSEKTRGMQGTSNVISYSYDAAGRLLKKKWPVVNDTLSPIENPYTQIPGDSVVYTYDSGGRMLTATSINYKVVRTYYSNGLLKQEIQSEDDGVTNKFTNYYEYDTAGRRTLHRIGSGGTNLVDTVTYVYSGTTGDLAELQVRWRATTRRDTVRYVWDELGRRKQLTYSKASGVSAPIVAKYAYDGDGALRRICSTHGGSTSVPFDIFDQRIGMDTVDKDGNVKVINTGSQGASGDTECPGYYGDPAITPQTRNTFDMRHQLLRAVAKDSIDFTYDNSGGMVKKLGHVPGSSLPAQDSLQFTVLAASNRMQTIKDFGNTINIVYNADGAQVRAWNMANPADIFSYHYYFYDALGRFTGEAHYECGGTVTIPNAPCPNNRVDLLGNPTACRYEALGRLVWNCGDPLAPSVLLGYDGENVVRTGPDAVTARWTFVHGPGTDDPLVGHYYNSSSGDHEYIWYMTDGQGRQYSLGDSLGVRYDTVTAGIFVYPKFAGGISSARTFDATRNGGNANLPGVSFFRNRFYDQQSGRWLQEDPLGVAVGTNLYQYVGNNPASYTDPFGLMADTTYVNCRPVGGEGDSGNFGHCAVRVSNAKIGVDAVFEEGVDEQGRVRVHSSDPTGPGGQAYTGPWTPVQVPEGMSVTDFDKSVLRQIYIETRAISGAQYLPTGAVNSNNFVYTTITQAGGRVPQAASSGFRLAPGICGGSLLGKGSDCAP